MSSYLYGPNFIEVTRGTTLEVTTESIWTTAEGTANLDLTGATVMFTVKAFKEDQVPIFHRKGTHGNGFTISKPKSGKIEFTLAATETAKLPVGVHYYDIVIILPGELVYQLVENVQFEVKQGATLR